MKNELRSILKRENVKFMMKRRRYFARIEWYFFSYTNNKPYKFVFSESSISNGIFKNIQANMKNISDFVDLYSDVIDQLCNIIEKIKEK